MLHGKHVFSIGVIGILLVSLSGCGSGDTGKQLDRQAITGSVTLDGQPLPNGTIRFEPVGKSSEATASGGVVSSGNFKLEESVGLPPGQYKVSISSSSPPTPLPKDPAAAMKAAEEAKPAPELIPEKYNSSTELTAEVKAGEQNVLTFDLKTK